MSNTVTWTGARLDLAVMLWRLGVSTSNIADALGVTYPAIQSLTCYRRDLFPDRGRAFKPVEATPEVLAPKVASDRVTRTTISGAKITLPRVTFIDGPYREGQGA